MGTITYFIRNSEGQQALILGANQKSQDVKLHRFDDTNPMRTITLQPVDMEKLAELADGKAGSPELEKYARELIGEK